MIYRTIDLNRHKSICQILDGVVPIQKFLPNIIPIEKN